MQNLQRKALRAISTTLLFSSVILTAAAAHAQASSVYIQDNTPAGRSASADPTKSVRSKIASAITDAYPCAETTDQQDVKDAIDDERNKNLQEDGGPDERLKEIGKMVGANILIGVQLVSGSGDSAIYSAFAMNSQSATTVARSMGTADQVAKGLTQQLSGSFSTNCKPHWVGTLNYTASISETNTIRDGGPMMTFRRNVKRTKTVSMNGQTTMTASLLPPGSGTKADNSPMARVSQIISTTNKTESNSSGEQYCRVRGQNPYWTGFSESYSETVVQSGRGSGTSPVFILIDSDGHYTIRVTVPGGMATTAVSTERHPSNPCGGTEAEPTADALTPDPTPFDASGFDAEGDVDPRNKDTLSGSYSTPDGKSRMSWNLRLVKPRGK